MAAAELNLHQKIIEIRKAVPYLQKDAKSHQYNYVSGASVIEPIRKKMDELGVILAPEIDHDSIEWSGTEVKFRMNYVWINAEKPEERYPVPWMAAGKQSEASKSFGSALTYAERYFFLKFLNIPTDKDDPDHRDNQKPSNGRTEKPTPAKRARGNKKQEPKPQPEQTQADRILETKRMAVSNSIAALKKLTEGENAEPYKGLHKDYKAKLDNVLNLVPARDVTTAENADKWIEHNRRLWQEVNHWYLTGEKIPEYITAAQVKLFHTTATEAGMTKKQRDAWLRDINIDSSKHIPKKDFEEILNAIKQKLPNPEAETQAA